MNIQCFTFNPFHENTYVIWDLTHKCIIIDPGCYTNKEKEEILNFIKENNLVPYKIINTHCHIDHIFGNSFIRNEWDIELSIHKKDLTNLTQSSKIAEMYGFKDYLESPNPNNFIEEGDIIRFGESEFIVLFTPGHSPGHICLYSQKNNVLIGGDLIFKESIGRTDLPGGNHKIMMKSVEKILNLKDQTSIYPGHGPYTTIQNEKLNNPFLR